MSAPQTNDVPDAPEFRDEPMEEAAALASLQRKAERDRYDAALAQIMDTKAGRRVVLHILASAGVFRLSYAPNDPFGTAFNEGQRNIGLQLVADLDKACPVLRIRMMEEHSAA